MSQKLILKHNKKTKTPLSYRLKNLNKLSLYKTNQERSQIKTNLLKLFCQIFLCESCSS